MESQNTRKDKISKPFIYYQNLIREKSTKTFDVKYSVTHFSSFLGFSAISYLTYSTRTDFWLCNTNTNTMYSRIVGGKFTNSYNGY